MPDAFWREERGTPRHRRLTPPPGSSGRLIPGPIQVLVSFLSGRHHFRTLNPEEARDSRPPPTVCFPRPQVHVEEHFAPASDLALQPGLQGVPLAQEETVYGLLPGFRTRQRRTACSPGHGPAGGVGMVSGLIAAYLPAGAALRSLPSRFFLLSHAKRLSYPPHPVSPFCRAKPSEGRLEGARSRVAIQRARDANGYQATSSDRGFLISQRIIDLAGSMYRDAPKHPERGHRKKHSAKLKRTPPGQLKREGDPSNRLGSITLRRTRLGVRALRHLVPKDTDFRPPFWLNNMSGKGNWDPRATRGRGARDGDAHRGRKGIEDTTCCPNKRGSARGLG